MKKYAITAFALTFLVFRTYGGERECLNFIYCSDLHYGLEREFRGGEVPADSVSRDMIGAFRLLEDTPLPEDGGVAAGTVYGKPAFVICTGDIANRMEDGVWPDSSMRGWYEAETADSSGFPVLLFTHDPPEAEAKHFTNPSWKHDINDTDKFQNLLSDISSVRYPDMEPEGNWKTLENFIASRPEIRAWFHGDRNYNEFYIWKGVDGSISLPVFRVDSPMKGEYSSEDETLLSFIAVSVAPHGRRLTARECLWNTGSAPGITWGETCTISL